MVGHGQLDDRSDGPRIGIDTTVDCTLEGEPHLELEIQRREECVENAGREGWVVIACAEKENRDHLEEVAKLIKVRGGKTFRETLKLHHINEHGDIGAVEILRERDGEA